MARSQALFLRKDQEVIETLREGPSRLLAFWVTEGRVDVAVNGRRATIVVAFPDSVVGPPTVALADGMTLDFYVGQGTTKHTVTFRSQYFSDITKATLDEVATQISNQLAGVGSYATNATKITHPVHHYELWRGGSITIYDQTVGASSYLAIIGGTAAPLLDLVNGGFLPTHALVRGKPGPYDMRNQGLFNSGLFVDAQQVDFNVDASVASFESGPVTVPTGFTGTGTEGFRLLIQGLTFDLLFEASDQTLADVVARMNSIFHQTLPTGEVVIHATAVNLGTTFRIDSGIQGSSASMFLIPGFSPPYATLGLGPGLFGPHAGAGTVADLSQVTVPELFAIIQTELDSLVGLDAKLFQDSLGAPVIRSNTLGAGSSVEVRSPDAPVLEAAGFQAPQLVQGKDAPIAEAAGVAGQQFTMVQHGSSPSNVLLLQTGGAFGDSVQMTARNADARAVLKFFR